MKKPQFIGRERELSQLNDIAQKKVASLVVVKGRRRVGKTSLIERFSASMTTYRFVGLAPVEGITATTQRDEFAGLLARQTGLPQLKTDDWSQLFALLAERVKKGRCVILFDEISWMAEGDDTFLSKLKNAWELYFSHNPELMLVLCGSISSWIEKNILSSTSFFGRISQTISLKEFTLPDCNRLLDAVGFKRSAYEKFMALSLTGGVPWYMVLLNPKLNAAENIKQLCFTPDGTLVKEYRYIFHDLFGKRSAIYERITRALVGGSLEYQALVKAVNYPSSGTLSSYVEELIEAGYIYAAYAWSFKTGKEGQVCLYRLTDHYLRFYYKYIEPKLGQILKGQYQEVDMMSLPAWRSMMGFQFETLVLNNRLLIQKALRIAPEAVINDNPYYQRKTARFQGCQIDYLIQTRLHSLFVCEIKYSANPLGMLVVHEMQDKIKRLSTPRNMVCLPVLIHVGGVTDELVDADYFFQIIDFFDLAKAD
jgi:uncharacterized protein